MCPLFYFPLAWLFQPNLKITAVVDLIWPTLVLLRSGVVLRTRSVCRLLCGRQQTRELQTNFLQVTFSHNQTRTYKVSFGAIHKHIIASSCCFTDENMTPLRLYQMFFQLRGNSVNKGGIFVELYHNACVTDTDIIQFSRCIFYLWSKPREGFFWETFQVLPSRSPRLQQAFDCQTIKLVEWTGETAQEGYLTCV